MSLSRSSCAGLAALIAAAALSVRAVIVRPEAHEEALVNPGMGMVYYHYANRLWAYGMNTRLGDACRDSRMERSGFGDVAPGRPRGRACV